MGFSQVQAQSARLLPDARLLLGLLDLPLLLAVTWAFRSWAKEERQMLKNIRRGETVSPWMGDDLSGEQNL